MPSPYEQLCTDTAPAQQYLLAAPVISALFQRQFDLGAYQGFLINAYHHVRYTVPLMSASLSRIHPSRVALVKALVSYIEEEAGHEQWILEDLSHCGLPAVEIADSAPNLQTELLVAYVRDYIHQISPVGFFGMAHVLEGTSTQLATQAAGVIQQHLNLSDDAFSYLRSHGELDVSHVGFFAEVLTLLTADELKHVTHVANRVYHLYGDVLRSITPFNESEAGSKRHVA